GTIPGVLPQVLAVEFVSPFRLRDLAALHRDRGGFPPPAEAVLRVEESLLARDRRRQTDFHRHVPDNVVVAGWRRERVDRSVLANGGGKDHSSSSIPSNHQTSATIPAAGSNGEVTIIMIAKTAWPCGIKSRPVSSSISRRNSSSNA